MSNQPLNQWLEPRSGIASPCIVLYRNRFTVPSSAVLKLKFSADQRGMMFLDGRRIAEGPERGTDRHWHYAEVSAPVTAGNHTLTVRVLAFGNAHWALGQMGIRPGLWVKEESNLLRPDWDCQLMNGCRLIRPQPDWGAFPRIRTDRDFNWAALNGEGGDWQPVRHFADSRVLLPPELPTMRYEPVNQFSWNGQTVVFAGYQCAWGEYEFSGTGRVELRWRESREPDGSLWDPGHFDSFDVSGEKIRWVDYWWRAGQRVEFRFSGDVKVESLRFYTTGYPYQLTQPLRDSNPARNQLLQVAWKTLQCCSFETFMDCPFYEQLQYVGDSRIEALCVLAATGDFRLPMKTLRLLGDGIQTDGTMFCRYPTREHAAPWTTGMDEALLIPGFAILYIQMVHDFAVTRRCDDLIRELLPGLRRIVAWLEPYRGADALLRDVPGWNFIDWVDGWFRGMPPYCECGTGCTFNLMYALALRHLADMEHHFGCTAAAARLEKASAQTLAAIHEVYFDAERNCFAEDEKHRIFSEHAQVFALLAGENAGALAAINRCDLPECSIYFSFYLLEVCAMYDLETVANQRMKKYLALAQNHGDTLPEEFQHYRSRCHAWSSNVLYFHFRTAPLFRPIPTPTNIHETEHEKETELQYI